MMVLEMKKARANIVPAFVAGGINSGVFETKRSFQVQSRYYLLHVVIVSIRRFM